MRHTAVSLPLWLENPPAERNRSRGGTAIDVPMPDQSFVPAAAMSYTAGEVFTVFSHLGGPTAIPSPTVIHDMEGAPYITCQANWGRRCRPEIEVVDGRLVTGDTEVCVDIVIDLDDPARMAATVGKKRPLARIDRLT